MIKGPCRDRLLKVTRTYPNGLDVDVSGAVDFMIQATTKKPDPNCPECRGSGKYVGFNKVESCSICDLTPDARWDILAKAMDVLEKEFKRTMSSRKVETI